MTNTILKGSPADKAGLKIGSYYTLKSAICGLAAGKAVQFTRDDGTNLPCFYADGLDGYDGWAYLPLHEINIPPAQEDHKFKVGDKVRVVDPFRSSKSLLLGNIYTVTEVFIRDGDQRVNINHPSDPTNTGSGYNVTRFELVKETELVVKENVSVTMDKIGDLVTVTITGKMSRDRVESLLNFVFDN